MPFISSVRGSFGSQGRFGRTISTLAGSTGGTISTGGGFTRHTFTATTQFNGGNTSNAGAAASQSATFTAAGSGNVEVLVVAGGGGGASRVGGGGGAGGLGYISSFAVTAGTYSVSLPTAGVIENFQPVGQVVMRDEGPGITYFGTAIFNNNNTGRVELFMHSQVAEYDEGIAVTASTPFLFSSNDKILIQITYESNLA